MQRLKGFMRTYWTRGAAGRPTPRSLTVLMLRFWIAAFAFKLLGSSWDVSWHFHWLRDDMAPPHIINTIGTGIAICLVLAHTFTGYATDKLSLRIMQTGTIVFVIAGPIDVINHRVNGLDITSWSPSHMLLYTGTAIMLVGVTRNFYLHYPREGRFGWQYTAGLTALGAFMFENAFFPNYQQEYGILSISSWFAGTPYAGDELLTFAANQLGRPVDDIAVHSFSLPIPPWVYPVWTIGLCVIALVYTRVLVHRFWAATVAATAYVAYRCLIWPALYFTVFPPSSVPFWLIAVGIGVDIAFLVPLRPYVRAVAGAVLVTGLGYLALLLQTLAEGTPLDLASQSVPQMRATFESGGSLETPPVAWGSIWWAAAALIVTWIAVTVIVNRTIGFRAQYPRAAAIDAPEPRRTPAGILDGFEPAQSPADAPPDSAPAHSPAD